jgi:hypothetical protein
MHSRPYRPMLVLHIFKRLGEKKPPAFCLRQRRSCCAHQSHDQYHKSAPTLELPCTYPGASLATFGPGDHRVRSTQLDAPECCYG